jgi:tetratricopeptide (TPR) repeat protein
MQIRPFGGLLLTVSLFLGTAVAQADTYSLLSLGREAALAGDLDEAERYHREAVDFAEQSGDSAELAEATGELGGIMLVRWRFAESKELLLKSLALVRDSKSKGYLPVVLSNLGVISMRRAEYAQSEAYFKEALRSVRAVPRPDGYEAQVHNHFGALYYTLKDLGKAEKAFKNAISVFEKALGPDRPELAPFLSNLGGVYVLRKKWDSATPLFDRALLLLQKSAQPDRLSLAAVLDNQGMLYRLRKNMVEAEKSLRKAYDLRLPLLGPENPLVVFTEVKLARTLREMGRYEDAEPLYSAALTAYEKTSSFNTMDAATTLEELAHLFRQTSREKNADPLEAKARAIRFELEQTVPARGLSPSKR